MTDARLGWFGIVRLGLVQTALGSIVVLTTSTMNRVMVVELMLPAMLPGLLVAIHYGVQIFRPRLGYGSDLGGRRTPWILGGILVLAAGGVGAATATAWMGTDPTAGMVLAVFAFAAIGIGVSAAGTSLLVLLAKRVDPGRRAAAATIVWVMMIVGFIVTATTAGHFLDPFTPARLVAVTAAVALCAVLLTVVAVHGLEGRGVAAPRPAEGGPHPSFAVALRQVWGEPQSRRFAVFVFVAMLAFSAQDLVLEPFAGAVFGMTPGESTKLAGVQHSGVLLGMLIVAVAGTLAGRSGGTLRAWTVIGCAASAAALTALACAGFVGPSWPLRESVFVLGVCNGVFAIGAIGSMMELAGAGRAAREGVRMGLWGAAEAMAFGLGGFLGTLGLDVARALLDSAVPAYASVFAGEALLYGVAGVLAVRVGRAPRPRTYAEPSLAHAERA